MNPIRRIIIPLLGLCLVAASIEPAQAQLNETPQSLNAAATDLMKQAQWEEALKLLKTCTDRFDKNAMTLYGPQFGVTWYRKGICELKLKKWDDAGKSFDTCYRKYSNKADGADGGGNIFNKRALLRGAEAAQGAEDWTKAITLFKKFLNERDKSRDSFQPGSFYINMAICHLRAGKIAEGVEHYETALKNKAAYQTPEAGIVAAFQALVDSVIEKRDEKALLAFVEKNRADIVIEPYDMQAYSGLFLSLAGKAYNAEMEASAFMLYQLIPPTELMLEDTQARLSALAGRIGVKDGQRVIRKDRLESAVAALETSLRGGNPNEVIQLSATAFLHEKNGNTRGAYMAYEQLERFFPKSKKREDYLYNLVRTASVVGEVMATEQYGTRFLDAFPDSEHVPAVRRLMLTSLFYGGQYQTCIEIASEMRPKLQEGTEQHDICLHVLGGSYYYTGDYREAQSHLDQHVELYPESKFEQAALYFQASNLSRLQFWVKSAKLLDAFLEKHSEPAENIYYAFALYDRANCHYALDENAAALDKLSRLETEFPNADIMDMALNLKGNVLQAEGDREQAEEYYKKALALAERRENRIVAGEALNYLVSLLGEKPKSKDAPSRLKDAVPYADKFWKEYGSDSPYKAQVAVGQIYALQDAGRGEEALERLQGVISEMASAPGAGGLEEAIGSYTDVYLDSHTAEELKEHYYNFPGIRASNRAARALLRIAVIGVFEDQLTKAADDEAKRIQAEAGIKVLFQDLKNQFDLNDLSNYILVRVGDFIRSTNSPREALPYYSEALARENDSSYKFPALFGRGAVNAKGTAAQQADAIKDFERVFSASQERSDKDRALYQMIVTYMDMGSYEKAKEKARLYLDREKGFSQNKMEVAMLLAQAYDEMKMVNDAIAAYVNVWNTYKGAIRISAPAMKRYMRLLWERNQEGSEVSDRQGAYNAGRIYVDQTRSIVVGDRAKASDEEVQMWREVERLVEEYVAHPKVKSKEQLEEEAAQR
ncbi:MAG: tetratricopeptide repeat protein [Verrucomicrobiales bacterium]